MKSSRQNAGFSLIEVMVAMLILGVAIVGLTAGLNTALVSNKDSEVQTVASMFAAGQIETTRANPPVSDGETEGDCGDELPMYRWKESVTPGKIDGLHEVKVTVENSRSGEAIYELQTMLFDPPLDKTEQKEAEREKKKGRKRE